MSRLFIGSVLLASISATLAFSAPTSAQVMEQFSNEVRYGDLNLTTDTGVAQLQRRIKAAARQACGYADGRDLKAAQAVAQCRQAAMTDAAPKVQLAVANARSGKDYAVNTAIKVGMSGNR